MVGRVGFAGVGLDRIFFARESDDSSDFFNDESRVGFGLDNGCATFGSGFGGGGGGGGGVCAACGCGLGDALA